MLMAVIVLRPGIKISRRRQLGVKLYIVGFGGEWAALYYCRPEAFAGAPGRRKPNLAIAKSVAF